MISIDDLILDLFEKHWYGTQSENLELAKKQLHKNLTDQVNGYWSGHTAYHIMTHGGFLVDSKRKRVGNAGLAEGKKLTALGQIFMDSMNTKCNDKDAEKLKQSNHDALINSIIESTGGEI
ncbi:hypothetical protein ACRN9C_03355 [Shewanella frigidimarina]|uniref:hypothetical protein n=1 Tax=Shewanella frigidimarina TaxID=56812 RepID=UPI003D79A28E